MIETAATLHILCGKIASGKSTLAAQLGNQTNAVHIAEDAWLSALFADEMASITDFVRCSARLREVMEPHIVAILNSGVSVILDFQANTVDSRRWIKTILDKTSAAHQLHVLDTPDALCLARLQARNAKGDHPFTVSDAQFHQITKHFVMPSEDEGFNLTVHKPSEHIGQ